MKYAREGGHPACLELASDPGPSVESTEGARLRSSCVTGTLAQNVHSSHTRTHNTCACVGSDAGFLAGCNGFEEWRMAKSGHTDKLKYLAQSKLGIIPQKETTAAMQGGKDEENENAELVETILGLEIIPVPLNVKVHRSRKYSATPDRTFRWCHALLECKSTAKLSTHSPESEEHVVPASHFLQVQQQMDVTGYPWAFYSQYISPKWARDGTEKPAEIAIFVIRYNEALFAAYVDQFVDPFYQYLNNVKKNPEAHRRIEEDIEYARGTATSAPKVKPKFQPPFVANIRGYQAMLKWAPQTAASRAIPDLPMDKIAYSDTRIPVASPSVHPDRRTMAATGQDYSSMHPLTRAALDGRLNPSLDATPVLVMREQEMWAEDEDAKRMDEEDYVAPQRSVAPAPSERPWRTKRRIVVDEDEDYIEKKNMDFEEEDLFVQPVQPKPSRANWPSRAPPPPSSARKPGVEAKRQSDLHTPVRKMPPPPYTPSAPAYTPPAPRRRLHSPPQIRDSQPDRTDAYIDHLVRAASALNAATRVEPRVVAPAARKRKKVIKVKKPMKPRRA